MNKENINTILLIIILMLCIIIFIIQICGIESRIADMEKIMNGFEVESTFLQTNINKLND